MGENTKIEWADHTFNPVRGCTKVAAGCANCYAEAQSKRNTGTLGIWGPNGTRVVAAESAWKQVEKWDREAAKAGESRSVFCGSMCDVFEDWSGQCKVSDGGWCVQHRKWGQPNGYGSCAMSGGNDAVGLPIVRDRLFSLIDATRLTYLLLTKRPENIRDQWINGFGVQNPSFAMRKNVWLGTSIACQEDADKNIPELLKCRDLCAGLFLSIEPLIGPVDLSKYTGGRLYRCECGYHSTEMELAFSGGDRFLCVDCGKVCALEQSIDQVIVGGESGPNARPCDIAWIRSIVRQCAAAGVSCFVKQLGSHVIGCENERHEMCNICIDRRPGTDAIVRWKLRDKKGSDKYEWPEDLRVRQLAWKGGV